LAKRTHIRARALFTWTPTVLVACTHISWSLAATSTAAAAIAAFKLGNIFASSWSDGGSYCYSRGCWLARWLCNRGGISNTRSLRSS
jgi:hypothetical protein